MRSNRQRMLCIGCKTPGLQIYGAIGGVESPSSSSLRRLGILVMPLTPQTCSWMDLSPLTNFLQWMHCAQVVSGGVDA